MTLVNLGHVTLNTRIDGQEGAPWILLSNSLGANLAQWDPQIGVLATKYRVLRYDTRGHGESTTPEGPYSLFDLQGDVLRLMDHFGIGTVTWMGLSMGAMTGMGLAIHHGDRFERMVLADARADAPDGFRNMWDGRIARISDGGMEAIADSTMETWLTEGFRSAHPEAAARLRGMITSTDPAGYIACAQGLKNLDYLRHLGRITLPVLYIGGADDPGAPPEVMKVMADATPGADYIEIADCAHIANVNASETFNAAIAPFLGLQA